MNVFRIIRIFLAAVFFLSLILIFRYDNDTIQHCFGWINDIQLVPALLSLNFIVIGGLMLLTLIFGRIYCSTICPLGIFQDLIMWIIRAKKNRFKYKKEHKAVRYVFLLAFLTFFATGLAYLISLIDPYSIFGRFFAQSSLQMPLIIVNIVSLIIICVFSLMAGRTYCNSICPVGTILGLLSRFSLFKIRIDDERCNGCGLCERNCKSSCILSSEHRIDYDRCVTCFNCIDKCKRNAMKFSLFKPKTSASQNTSETSSVDKPRRAFLAGLAAVGTGYAMSQTTEKLKDAVLSVEGKSAPKRTTSVLPAGALSFQNFASKCTACQLCTTVCPTGVLRPSSSLSSFMQVNLDFSQGYCDIDCNKCSQVCATGALKPVSLEQKNATQVGHAVIYPELCTGCGKCESTCPAGTITMVANNGKKLAAVDTEFCIGCGACEFHCKAKAIIIEGHEVHKEV